MAGLLAGIGFAPRYITHDRPATQKASGQVLMGRIWNAEPRCGQRSHPRLMTHLRAVVIVGDHDEPSKPASDPIFASEERDWANSPTPKRGFIRPSFFAAGRSF